MDFWHKQPAGKPLFEKSLWNRPENKRTAGKLLIVGGNAHGFAAPATAYNAALSSGIGSARVLLPASLHKTVGMILEAADFAPSTPSGSFGKDSLAQLCQEGSWADGVLLSGDFGRNSETAIMLESFINKYSGQMTLAQDSLDYFLSSTSQIVKRPETTLVINLAKLQRLAKVNRRTTPVISTMSLHELVVLLSRWTVEVKTILITKHADQFVVACGGQVSTTPAGDKSNWQVELAAAASVWWLQQPKSPFEAITSAVFEYNK